MTSREIEISVVVPCHNAEKFFQNTIGHLYSNLNTAEELIIVENGSTDDTLIRLLEFFDNKISGEVKVIQSPKGLGIALKQGIDQARGKKIVFMQDDLPFGLQELNLARNLDVSEKYFILSKYHGNISGFRFRKIQGLVFIFVREIILGVKVKDSQATFFGDSKIVKKLASACKQKGFLITLELIALARKSDIGINEIPCDSLANSIRPTTLKLRDEIQMFIGLFQIKKDLNEVNIEKI